MSLIGEYIKKRLSANELEKELLKLIKEYDTKLNTKNSFWVCTLSELHPVKGIYYAIEAIEILVNRGHDITFIVFGEGDHRNALEKLILKKNLQKHVFLLGFVQNASSYLKAFDLFSMTSISEAFCYAILEAGKAGLPVIASRVGGIPEVIDDNFSGILVESKNSKSIANAMEQLLLDENKRVQFAKNLERKITEQFSFEQMLNGTLDVYTLGS